MDRPSKCYDVNRVLQVSLFFSLFFTPSKIIKNFGAVAGDDGMRFRHLFVFVATLFCCFVLLISSTLRDGGRVHDNTAVINGTNLHGCFRFGKLDGKPLDCKVALSSVSMENARLNMQQEAPHWDFDRYVAAADANWEQELGKIEVKGTALQKEIFYTALYHTMIQPNTMSDVNGEWRREVFHNERI